jgi:YD repeat-containing protein
MYLDAEGQPTDDAAKAMRGEVVVYDAHGRPTRRTRFFLDRSELPWLPVSEPAFLLWVFAGLFVVWLAIGLFLLA